MKTPEAKETQFGFIYSTAEVDLYILYAKKLEKRISKLEKYSSEQRWKNSVSQGHK